MDLNFPSGKKRCPAPPVDFEAAMAEIDRLRQQLLVANEKWASAVEKRVMDNRANQGSTRKKREALLRELIGVLRALKSAMLGDLRYTEAHTAGLEMALEKLRSFKT